MISTKIIQSGLEDLKRITKADFHFCDSKGIQIASTFESGKIDKAMLSDFAMSKADSQNVKGYNYMKLVKDDEESFILVVYAGGEDGYMYGRIAASEIYHLMAIDNGRMDREDFYKEMLHGDIMPGEIAKRADKLKIATSMRRIVYLIKVDEDFSESAREMLKNLFSENKLDQVLMMEDNTIALVKVIEDGDEPDLHANQIVAMINMELMIRARVTYGRYFFELKEMSEAYKEASMAMEVVNIFYEDKDVASYTSLGIGRLIHKLPKNLCEMFLDEVLGDKLENALLPEEIIIIEKFFQNNLNISETARTLDMHRTTFIYRLDRLEKKTGLDIRKFDDAMTLKIAMMVSKYINYRQ